MTYFLKKITPADIQKILADADQAKQHEIKRRDYFNEWDDFYWALDTEKNSYLLRAPTIDVMSQYACFYFHFKNFTYRIRLQAMKNNPVQIDEQPAASDFSEFQEALTAAFIAFQSMDDYIAFVPVFTKAGE